MSRIVVILICACWQSRSSEICYLVDSYQSPIFEENHVIFFDLYVMDSCKTCKIMLRDNYITKAGIHLYKKMFILHSDCDQFYHEVEYFMKRFIYLQSIFNLFSLTIFLRFLLLPLIDFNLLCLHTHLNV